MADGYTYGINFPFQDSYEGKYLDLNPTTDEEIRTDLVHLILTRKGSRYFLPDFGTRLYEYLFEPLDGPTFSDISAEIRQAVEDYMPNLKITNITVVPASAGEENKGTYINDNDQREFRVTNISQLEHTAKIKIEYVITDSAFSSSDFVIINI
jgi:phage baseplate assembly protein W